MADKEKAVELETNYLEKTLGVVNEKIELEQRNISNKREDLIAARKEMHENTAHATNDIGQRTEMVQYLTSLNVQTQDFDATAKRIEKYKKLLDSPYFARIDFIEEGFDKESIYIGRANLSDDKTHDIYVYDWRVPISSIFYRYELGEANYEAPGGTVRGNVSLKRQYEIKGGKLEYFFDSNVNVIDDILKKVLSNNTSAKMKTIVESIQREQDVIIRDTENDLVIVQGVAGSGKTSVALHRVAFLMYQGLTEKLTKNNITLISPNHLFGQYISNVLPELGEENIKALTFEELFPILFREKMEVKSRNSLLEEIMVEKNPMKARFLKSNIKFKLSKEFAEIIERYLRYFERRMIKFSDVYFNNECVLNRHLLKMAFLNKEKSYIPIEKRLEQIEALIMSRVEELKKDRLNKVEKFVYEQTNHPFDSRPFARLLVRKQIAALKRNIYQCTKINYLLVYKTLFNDKELFYRLAKGIKLPDNIDDILNETKENLEENEINYDDAMALMFLKAKMSGCNSYSDIKQVVVDEAQDYYPLHYEILKILFPNAKYTVVGDVNQTIEKSADLTIYHEIEAILNKSKSLTILMKKSFRCSHEINSFSSNFIHNNIEIESFDRHGNPPAIINKSNDTELDDAIIADVLASKKSGYSSIAIICKSLKQAREVHQRIKNRLQVELITEDSADTVYGVLIVPVYMAKGLEFDAVMIYGTDKENYQTEDDKNLLYIACTRALHSLSLYYTGQISELLSSVRNK